MMEQKLLNALKAEQARYALQALRQPNQRDSFEYGYRSGIVGGLEMAVDILLKLVEQDEKDGADL